MRSRSTVLPDAGAKNKHKKVHERSRSNIKSRSMIMCSIRSTSRSSSSEQE
jgi:hypothetical protein